MRIINKLYIGDDVIVEIEGKCYFAQVIECIDDITYKVEVEETNEEIITDKSNLKYHT